MLFLYKFWLRKTLKVYIKIHGPYPTWPPHVTTNLKLYLKIFSLKGKKIKYFQLLYKKSRPFWAYSCIFLHILTYLEPWHIQYQWHIQNPCIFTTLTYSEPWYLHNTGIFRALANSQPYILHSLLSCIPRTFQSCIF